MTTNKYGAPFEMGDISHADDLVSTAGLLRRADILSAFTLLFDMELSINKLWLEAFGHWASRGPMARQRESSTAPGGSLSGYGFQQTGTLKMLGIANVVGKPQ